MEENLKYLDYFYADGSFSGITYSLDENDNQEISVSFQGNVDDYLYLKRCKIYTTIHFKKETPKPIEYKGIKIKSFANYTNDYDVDLKKKLETKCFYLNIYENIENFDNFIKILNIHKDCSIYLSLRRIENNNFFNEIKEKYNKEDDNIEDDNIEEEDALYYVDLNDKKLNDKYFPLNWYHISPIKKNEEKDNNINNNIETYLLKLIKLQDTIKQGLIYIFIVLLIMAIFK